MKIPALPPDPDEAQNEFVERALKGGDQKRRLLALFGAVAATDDKGRYLHWEELRFRPTPEGIDPKHYWALVKMARRRQAKITPFTDEKDHPFTFVQTDYITRSLHEIDSETRGGVQFAGVTPTDQEAERFLVKSLVEEPFNSSLLEGAATTREEAKRLIRQNKHPQTLGEKMVLNNYRAIEFIKDQKSEPLTVPIINELHRIITSGTLDNPTKAGVFRDEKDKINVVDEIDDKILHRPPPAKFLESRVKLLCSFANGELDGGAFIHPILRAIIIHFMLAYDHPYVDGNGRTARALFYWSVLRDGYWLLEYISISKIINLAPKKYGMAFLYVETDQNDLTYFLHHQLEVILKSINELGVFIGKKQAELQSLGEALSSKALRDALNHRQLALLHDALRSPGASYTINEHVRINNVSYLTARSDLERLAAQGFLIKHKRGNTSFYRVAPNLPQKLGAVAGADG